MGMVKRFRSVSTNSNHMEVNSIINGRVYAPRPPTTAKSLILRRKWKVVNCVCHRHEARTLSTSRSWRLQREWRDVLKLCLTQMLWRDIEVSSRHQRASVILSYHGARLRPTFSDIVSAHSGARKTKKVHRKV